MRLAISNIAWEPAEDAAVAKLLNAHRIDAIDVAPTKYFPEPSRAPAADIQKVRRWWADHGIEIFGMQSLLFGTSGLNLFGSDDVQKAMLEHLSAVCRIANGLGARRLVFGSPRNRDRSGLGDAEALAVAVRFFSRLGEIAQAEDVAICLEPNPARYGCNFMTNSRDTAEVVRAVDHPAVRMQLDTGAHEINSEPVAAVLEANAALIGHVHASEPDLVPLGDGTVDHRAVGAALKKYLPDAVVSVEMVATRDEPHIVSIERALRAAVEGYRGPAALTQRKPT